MVLFLASLPEDEYKLLLEIFEKYESFKIKDQSLSGPKRGKCRQAKLDCKGSYFKPLRGLDEDARRDLLSQLFGEEISFQELAASCKYAKQMRNVQSSFMKYLDIPSWEIAVQKYPEHTTSERLEPFLDLSFKADSMPPSFVSFCRHAKQTVESSVAGTSSLESRDSQKTVHVGNVLASILKKDVLTVGTQDLLSSVTYPNFCGLNLTILDPPMVSILVYTCMLRV